MSHYIINTGQGPVISGMGNLPGYFYEDMVLTEESCGIFDFTGDAGSLSLIGMSDKAAYGSWREIFNFPSLNGMECLLKRANGN